MIEGRTTIVDFIVAKSLNFISLIGILIYNLNNIINLALINIPLIIYKIADDFEITFNYLFLISNILIR